MKEPRGESLANYADLESCAGGGGDAAGEELTEARAGRLLSREIPLFGRRPLWTDREGRIDCRVGGFGIITSGSVWGP